MRNSNSIMLENVNVIADSHWEYKINTSECLLK